ncbi:MAG: hypothetical protein M1602_06285 [Firmicutes bacterium]|nr:hypothetical protein [Bacillota bacterium]
MMRTRLARLGAAVVLLVVWHLFLAWLARQAMPGSATRWSILPYVGVSLICLAGAGWVSRHLSADAGDEAPNRWQAVAAMAAAQVLLQAIDWLVVSGPGDWSLSLLGLPLVGLGPLVTAVQLFLPPVLATVLDRTVTIAAPLLVTYFAPGDDGEDTGPARQAVRPK